MEYEKIDCPYLSHVAIPMHKSDPLSALKNCDDTMQRIANASTIVIGIVLLIGLPCVAWVCIRTLFLWITTQESQIATAVIAAAATVLAGFGAVIISQQRSKSREIAESHRPKKMDVYTRFIKKTMEVVLKYKDDASSRDLVTGPEFEKFFHEFTTDLVLWGSSEVVQTYAKFREANEEESSLNSLAVMDELIRVMRKDLGHRDNNLKRGDLIKIFLRDPDEFDKMLSTTPGQAKFGHKLNHRE